MTKNIGTGFRHARTHIHTIITRICAPPEREREGEREEGGGGGGGGGGGTERERDRKK
jgi:hypothetical protein